MMPRTPHGVIDHEPFSERSAVMGTDSTDREIFIAAAREKYGFLADMPCEHLTVGKVIDRDALLQVRTGHVRLRCAH